MRNADEKRRQIARAAEEYEAIMFLLNSLTSEGLSGARSVVVAADSSTRRELDRILLECKAKVADLRRDYGVRISSDEVVALYRQVRAGGPGGGLSRAYFVKARLEKWVKSYSKIYPNFDRLPPHARIALMAPPQAATTEIFLPEAILFEEMAMLFNEAERAHKDLGAVVDSFRTKRFRSLLHACHTTTFHFIEAYLSGIAFDFASRNAGRIADRDFVVLTEWDLEKGRTRYVSFRDRLIQIPRIILGVQHPPLTESNEPSIGILLREGKAFRDAIVHSSPLPPIAEVINRGAHTASTASALAERRMSKEDYLAVSDLEPLTKIVDAAVEVVTRIDSLIDGYMTHFGYLHRRTPEGVFPPGTFS